MESQPQNPEFRNNLESLHPFYIYLKPYSSSKKIAADDLLNFVPA